MKFCHIYNDGIPCTTKCIRLNMPNKPWISTSIIKPIHKKKLPYTVNLSSKKQSAITKFTNYKNK